MRSFSHELGSFGTFDTAFCQHEFQWRTGGLIHVRLLRIPDEQNFPSSSPDLSITLFFRQRLQESNPLQFSDAFKELPLELRVVVVSTEADAFASKNAEVETQPLGPARDSPSVSVRYRPSVTM